MFFKSLALLALAASPTLANIFITEPTASSTFTAGQQATIQWQDDGKAPSLQDLGNCVVSIYVGNAQQQTSLQTIAPSVNVAQTNAIQFTPNADIGPNGNEYFIRVESLTAKDSSNPQFPAMAFSAKFTMAGMSGQFTPEVQAQIAGQSTAPLAGQTAPAGSPTGGAAPAGNAATTGSPSASSSRKPSGASSSASPSKTASGNGALSVKAGWAGVFLSALVYVAVL